MPAARKGKPKKRGRRRRSDGGAWFPEVLWSSIMEAATQTIRQIPSVNPALEIAFSDWCSASRAPCVIKPCLVLCDVYDKLSPLPRVLHGPRRRPAISKLRSSAIIKQRHRALTCIDEESVVWSKLKVHLSQFEWRHLNFIVTLQANPPPLWLLFVSIRGVVGGSVFILGKHAPWGQSCLRVAACAVEAAS